jgi:hypothetical protein
LNKTLNNGRLFHRGSQQKGFWKSKEEKCQKLRICLR